MKALFRPFLTMAIVFLIATVVFALWPSSAQAASTDWRKTLIIPTPGNDVMVDPITPTECMALAIYWEARGEVQLGQEVVAQVVYNRTGDAEYPDDPCSVVRERKQFQWAEDGLSDRPLPGALEEAAWRSAYIMAIEFMFLGRKAPVPNAEKLMNFHAGYVAPGWTDRKPVMYIGGHIFYTRH